ncbi:DUF2461 domain-containing protein [Dermatobacter hominis]|uniref:DUF2461 domain-containing protein n=1 Tax=Dermatobacter hominis TaxID=2884263 RepID=UPI001D0FBE76|nr:DUF2461 domain-containing protein [Dermatobacter hominis]UDY34854.1 DUF2461 domain-containing protein [Dermatobacter hominis]
MAGRSDDDEAFRGFPAAALEFFDDLEADNTKEWFHAHRDVYDRAVKAPMAALVQELEPEFGPMTLSRPNRDVRFARGRGPYKLEVYARSRRHDGAGWYVQLMADGLFAGGGIYMPDREQLARLRAAIADDRTGAELVDVVAGLEADGVELMRDGALRTAPRGWPADHPRIELLRLVHLAGGRRFPVRRWLHTAAARDRVVETWRSLQPLVDWIGANV